MNSHVRELLTDLGPELGNNAEEILKSIDTNVAVLVLEKGEGTRCMSALLDNSEASGRATGAGEAIPFLSEVHCLFRIFCLLVLTSTRGNGSHRHGACGCWLSGGR